MYYEKMNGSIRGVALSTRHIAANKSRLAALVGTVFALKLVLNHVISSKRHSK